jgi:hypothetical protein
MKNASTLFPGAALVVLGTAHLGAARFEKAK